MTCLRRYPAVVIASTAFFFVALGALAWAAGASARTLGSLAPPDRGGCAGCNAFKGRVAAGEPKSRVPKGPTGLWTITSSSAQGEGSADGQAQIRVYRKTSTPGQFELIRESDFETVPASGSPFFATSLNVRRGDLLGLHTVSFLPVAYSPLTAAGDVVKLLGCGPSGPGELVGKGTTCPLNNHEPALVNVVTELTPR